MRAVFLDYQSLRPADLRLDSLRALPLTLELFDATQPGQTAERIREADIVISNKVVLDAALIAAAPRLRLIAVTATGTNNIDREVAAARGIAVVNVQAYGTAAVAQHSFALLLALTNRLREYGRDAVNGRWSQSPVFCLMDHPVVDLAGKTLGLVGYGELGQAVGRLGEAFGMRVLVAEGQRGAEPGRVPLAQLLREADVLSLHCLLSPQTEKLINAGALAQMKSTALLVNTARGGLIDEPALVQALRTGQIAGAALDVLSVEPPPLDHPLLQADIPNLLITPHCAWVSPAARQRLLDATADNIRRFLDERR